MVIRQQPQIQQYQETFKTIIIIHKKYSKKIVERQIICYNRSNTKHSTHTCYNLNILEFKVLISFVELICINFVII